MTSVDRVAEILSQANGTRAHLSVYTLVDGSIEIEVQHEPAAGSSEYVIDTVVVAQHVAQHVAVAILASGIGEALR